ncbi:hypothetical protein [Cupriavidus basilensis]|uniref:hypothetical protein n=1 Tax=Cupriavidus basilensis TaxID=68895 RepID=UPI0020A6C99E|nr:hypothetical protein [Cupriavidus basilensis]MCP3017410.1 hypothetical protein [Cupriavidus basilensis]
MNQFIIVKLAFVEGLDPEIASLNTAAIADTLKHVACLPALADEVQVLHVERPRDFELELVGLANTVNYEAVTEIVDSLDLEA